MKQNAFKELKTSILQYKILSTITILAIFYFECVHPSSPLPFPPHQLRFLPFSFSIFPIESSLCCFNSLGSGPCWCVASLPGVTTLKNPERILSPRMSVACGHYENIVKTNIQKYFIAWTQLTLLIDASVKYLCMNVCILLLFVICI